MVFPATALAMTVELLIGGTWTDIASLVYGRDDLVVTRGRADEAAQVDRSLCRLTANNRLGNLSPRNPVGTWYGKIGRNTRMRVRVTPASPGYLLVPGGPGAPNVPFFQRPGASTPDTAALSITGDTDIRIDIQPDQWGRAAELCSKWDTPLPQQSWALQLGADNKLTLTWSTTGADVIAKTSTVAITPPASRRLAVRATLDVNNGASGNDVKFYTAPTIGGTWTQLGATVTTAGVTSVFDSTAPVRCGSWSPYLGTPNTEICGRVYAFKLLQGIGGTLKADVDFDADAGADDVSFVGSDGLTWTLAGDATIVDPDVRFSGEISEWPQRWDVSGKDVHVPLEASGILRRLTQGTSALKSTMRRGYTNATFTPRAYWPCEDGPDSTQIASGLPGGPPMTFVGTGLPTFAASTGFKCSSPLPTLASSWWVGTVPPYTATSIVQVWFLMHIPTGAPTSTEDIIHVHTTGTGSHWVISYVATGQLKIECFNSAGTSLFSSTIAFAVLDKLLRVNLELVLNGADTDWKLETMGLGTAPFTSSFATGTLAGRTPGRVRIIQVNTGTTVDPNDQIAIGHISVHDEVRSIVDLGYELNAYEGEVAYRRVQRLCDEEGIRFRGITRRLGGQEDSAALGPQLPLQLVTLLRDAGDADGGVLYEPRDLFGLAYRTRESLYRQDAQLALDYTSKHLSGIEPTDDDQQVRNDVTVQRPSGSSARAQVEGGPLSVQAPPDGIGRYDTSVTLNLATDHQAADAAGWLVHLGTVDEARYPVLQVNLARAVWVADPTLSLAALDLDVGDRVTVDSPPAWLPPDQISQLAQGMVETMSNFTRRVDYNCAPESPWAQTGVYDDSASRYSSDGSTLAAALTSTTTSVSVATPSGPLWSHVDGDFTIRVGGETMTVTAVSGTSSPQTFTCTRSVNGVVKAHSSGATVTLDHPTVWGR